MYKVIPGCKTPESLLYDISGKVGRIINNEGENIKPPVMGSDDFEKKIKDFTNKKKYLIVLIKMFVVQNLLKLV